MEKDSIQNLNGVSAGSKIKELAENSRSCCMLTALNQLPIKTRPMAVQKVDARGCIYFLSHRTSDKNSEITASPYVQLVFINEGKAEYLTLYGKAFIYHSQSEIDEMYSPFANNWFDGKDDPNISIIRFEPEEGHYWDTKHNKVMQMAGILIGAVTGKQMDDGVEGNLKP
jgi:general stress protein 26